MLEDSDLNRTAAIVQQHLQPLVGLRLSIARRAATMRIFHFGIVRPIAKGTAGEYALHVQCPWRIETNTGIITGYADLWQPAGKDDKVNGETWDYEDGNLQDERLSALLGGYDSVTRSYVNTSNTLIVEAVDGDCCGSATLRLSGGYRLLLFSSSSGGEDWRMLRPDSADPHFVIVGGKVED